MRSASLKLMQRMPAFFVKSTLKWLAIAALPPLPTIMILFPFLDAETMASFMAKKKAEDMRYQLKQIISLSRGPAAWDELLATEGAIRKKRQKMIYEQQERQRKFVEYTAIFVGVAVMGTFLIWLLILTLKAQGIMH